MRVAAYSFVFAMTSLFASISTAGTIVSTSADFDRWMYSFNASPGIRTTAPTFFDGQTPGAFDNMDGQFLVGFDTTAAGVTPLGPGEMYQINSVTVTATHSSGAFTYDPTFDNYASYLDGSDPNFVADSDTGRPIEIYGTGLRGGYTEFGFAGGITAPTTFNEGSFFAFGDPSLSGVRNAFAYDPSFGDVSNAVDNSFFGASPWAVGQAAGLSAGSSVPQGSPGTSSGQTFSFDIDLGHAGVLDYLTEGLEDGGLFFSIVSLQSTTQQGGGTPNFYTSENFDPFAIAPTITIDYDIVSVPEPSTLVLSAIGLVGIAACQFRTRRSRKS